MRTLIALVLGFVATAAVAFDGQKAAEEYYQLRGECRVGDTLTAEESEKQCVALNKLGEELRANGFCWYQPEQEWRVCPK